MWAEGRQGSAIGHSLMRVTLDTTGEAPMQDTLTPQGTDPHDAFEIAPGVVLAGRTEKPSPALAPGAASALISALSPPLSAPPKAPLTTPWTPHVAMTPEPAAPMPSAEPDFHVTADDRVGDASGGKWARRIFMCLFAVSSAAAAAAWPHYSDAAKQTIANWIPPFAMISSQPPATTAASPPVSPAVEASAQPVSTQPAAPAQPAPDIAPPTAAAATTSAPTPQSMTRDIAAMGQQIEQLKASIEQLKAGQEKIADQMAAQPPQQAVRKPQAAKLPDPNARPRLSALPVPPRPIRKPRPEFSPAQTAAILAAPRTAAAPALPPSQAAPAPTAPAPYNAQARVIDRTDGDPVDRPPMPLR
jgi:hypothetical protein